MCPQRLGQKTPQHITIRWLGGRFPPISKVEEVKMLEPDMSLPQPRSSLMNSSNPETPVSKHRQLETLLSHKEWSWEVPPEAFSRNIYQEARAEVIIENIKS